LQITVEPAADCRAPSVTMSASGRFDNLLENSYDYTDAGGSITVRVRPTGDEIEVVIQDSGIGIPPQAQPRIFERFLPASIPLY